MDNLKRDNGRTPEPDYLDDLIADTSTLIASVYDMLGQQRSTPRVITPILGRRSHNNSDSSGQLGSNSNSPVSPKTPRLCTSSRNTVSTPSSQEIDREIKRIDRFCEMLEHNLQTVATEQEQLGEDSLVSAVSSSPGRRVATLSPRCTPPRTTARMLNSRRSPTPEEVIDLSDSTYTPTTVRRSDPFSFIDDVVIVTPSVDEIVDLCTPTFHRNSIRSGSNTLNRRPPTFSLNVNVNTNANGTRHRVAYRRPNSISVNRPISRRTLSSISTTPSVQMTNNSTSSRCSVSATTSTTNIGTAQIHTNSQNKNKPNEAPGAHNDNSDDSVKTDNGRAPFMCAVCMESSINNQPTSTKCGHVFCAKCIGQALRLSRKCPMCNTKLTANMLFRIYV